MLVDYHSEGASPMLFRSRQHDGGGARWRRKANEKGGWSEKTKQSEAKRREAGRSNPKSSTCKYRVNPK